MKTLKLIGYTKTEEDKPAGTEEWQEHDEGGTYWALYFFDNKEFFEVTISNTYGSCMSGYTSASWGSISQVKKVDSIPKDLTKCVKSIFIELLKGDILNVVFADPKQECDASVETLLSTDGEIIAQSTGDGGCCYYPSGEASINDELFVGEPAIN